MLIWLRLRLMHRIIFTLILLELGQRIPQTSTKSLGRHIPSHNLSICQHRRCYQMPSIRHRRPRQRLTNALHCSPQITGLNIHQGRRPFTLPPCLYSRTQHSQCNLMSLLRPRTQLSRLICEARRPEHRFQQWRIQRVRDSRRSVHSIARARCDTHVIEAALRRGDVGGGGEIPMVSDDGKGY